MRKTKKSPSQKVTAIDTEYTRAMQDKENYRKVHKKRLRNRLFVFAIIVCVVAGSLFNMNAGQQKLLADKQQERETAKAELEQLQAEQTQLNRQLILLDDDEYIAKLARKEYFLSEDDEIIFSIPDSKKETEKEPRKE